MITIDRMSLPLSYTPKVGDLLEITEISGGDGRWKWGVKAAGGMDIRLSKRELAWLMKHLMNRDAAAFMLWHTTGKPLEEEQ